MLCMNSTKFYQQISQVLNNFHDGEDQQFVDSN